MLHKIRSLRHKMLFKIVTIIMDRQYNSETVLHHEFGICNLSKSQPLHIKNLIEAGSPKISNVKFVIISILVLQNYRYEVLG